MKVDGEKIRELRMAKGLTQEQLAIAATIYVPPSRVGEDWQQVSINAKTVRNMEKEARDHRPSTVLAVATALEVTMEYVCLDAPLKAEVWEQTILDENGTPEKWDEVHLVHLGDLMVAAKIYRKKPTVGEEYEFLGRHAEGMIYGHYWHAKGRGSGGVLLLRETGPEAISFQGQYTKIKRDVVNITTDTLTISHIDLHWAYQGLLEPSARSQITGDDG